MTPLHYPDWRKKIVFSPNGPRPQVLTETEKFKAIVAGLEPGQTIPSHPEASALYYFLEGSGSMIVGGERFAVGPGATVIAPQGAERGIEADSRLAFLAVRVA